MSLVHFLRPSEMFEKCDWNIFCLTMQKLHFYSSIERNRKKKLKIQAKVNGGKIHELFFYLSRFIFLFNFDFETREEIFFSAGDFNERKYVKVDLRFNCVESITCKIFAFHRDVNKNINFAV